MKSPRLRGPAFTDGLGGFFAVACVLVVTIWALHPSLLVANTLTTGGDTGAHVALPWFLRTQLLAHGHLTGWYPGWFDGFPVYTYYFVLSDLVAAIGSYLMPYAVAFKLATVLGSLLLPVCAYAMGRLFSLRAPLPACLAASTLPFLFDTSYTILGGNLFSTLAGEYAFSLGLALSLVAVGLFARGLRTGRGVIVSSIVLALTLGAHILPWLWALVGVAVLVVIDLLPARLGFRDPLPAPARAPLGATLSFAARAGALSLALSAWWLIPWVSGQSLAISMGYQNDGSNGAASFGSMLFPGDDHIMIVLAVIGLGVAWATRSRFGVWLTTLTALASVAYVLDPQGALWDERLLPFWFVGSWLTCGWLFGVSAAALVRRSRQRSRERWIAGVHEGYAPRRFRILPPMGWPAGLGGAVLAGAIAVVVVVPPLVTWVPRSLLTSIGITPGANEVPVWSAYNYTGYQGVAGWSSYNKDWNEYHAIVTMMRRAGSEHGCGQAMWQYDGIEGEFGTTESLMLLPYWTDNCIGSMEGLLFESSATTPFHFLNQAELSLRPSDPMVGLPYGPSGSPNVSLGLRHLQLLGVRYFLAFSPTVVEAATDSGIVQQIATTGPWHYNNHVRTWHLFRVRDAAVVTALGTLPNVVTSARSRAAWQSANVSWWLDPRQWGVMLAQSGPPSWPRILTSKHTLTLRIPKVFVSRIRVSVSSLSFHVDRVGVPVVVRVSYYPRWHALGAAGPWRVSPNLMVVVPTSHEVVLTYGGSLASSLGGILTLLGGLTCVVAAIYGRWRRRAARLTA